jgi:hypothetical protein
MTRWELRLKLNHPFSDNELGCWLNLFDSPACKVTRKEDGGYYLTAYRLEKLNDNEVGKSANNLITMMTAFAKIELDIDFQSIEHDDEVGFISSMREQSGDKSNVYVPTKTAKAYAFANVPTVVIQDKDGNIVPQERQEHWYDDYLSRCDDRIDSTVMFTALNYFAQKTTAFALWWAYESIENDEGGFYNLVRSNKWVTEDELRFFTDSLNRYDIDGHGRHVENPKDDYLRPKMSLPEAQTFLAERLLKPWLIKKKSCSSWPKEKPLPNTHSQN